MGSPSASGNPNLPTRIEKIIYLCIAKCTTKKALIEGAFFVVLFGYASIDQDTFLDTILGNSQIIHPPQLFWLLLRAVFLYSIPGYTTYP